MLPQRYASANASFGTNLLSALPLWHANEALLDLRLLPVVHAQGTHRVPHG